VRVLPGSLLFPVRIPNLTRERAASRRKMLEEHQKNL